MNRACSNSWLLVLSSSGATDQTDACQINLKRMNGFACSSNPAVSRCLLAPRLLSKRCILHSGQMISVSDLVEDLLPSCKLNQWYKFINALLIVPCTERLQACTSGNLQLKLHAQQRTVSTVQMCWQARSNEMSIKNPKLVFKLELADFTSIQASEHPHQCTGHH